MVAHVVLITLGYAATSPKGLWGTIVDFVLNYPGMLLAVAGTVALCAVVATSMRAARRRLRYESWHLIHLYAYLGVGLALPHQLWTGQEFLTSPVATVYWWTLYAAALASVLVWRVGLPVYRSLRHGLVVTDVRAESPGVTTVTVGGRDLHRLPVRAGQFLHWRFLGGPGWSRAHPYSLSAAPDGRTLRITATHLGDGSLGAVPAAAGHPGAGRGTVRAAARRGPHPRQGAADGLGHRHHPDARAAGGARAAARRRRARLPRPQPAGRDPARGACRARRGQRRARVHRHRLAGA